MGNADTSFKLKGKAQVEEHRIVLAIGYRKLAGDLPPFYTSGRSIAVIISLREMPLSLLGRLLRQGCVSPFSSY